MNIKSTLRNIWAVFLREWVAYFFSPTAYVVLFLFMITNGITFYLFCFVFRTQSRQIDLIVQYMFGFWPFWFLFILIPPILTMRLVSEEKRTGTLESLMTAPVTDWQVILGKFFAAHGFFMFLWSTNILFMVILGVLGNPDWGPVLAFYVGVFSLGALFNAIGVFASTLTRNQLISAIIALMLNLFLFFLNQCRALFPKDPEAQRFFDFISLHHHFFEEYSRGIVDLRYQFLYFSFTVAILFYSVRVLEARKWR